MTSSFGQTLRTQRLRLKKDLKTISAETGLKEGQLSRIELGRVRQPRPDSIERMAVAYELPRESLMLLAGYGHRPELMNNLPLFISDAARVLSVEDWEPLRAIVAHLVAEKTIAGKQP